MQIWEVGVDNIVISKLIVTKNIIKCLIGYLNDALIPIALTWLTMKGYLKISEDKDWEKTKIRTIKWCLFTWKMICY